MNDTAVEAKVKAQIALDSLEELRAAVAKLTSDVASVRQELKNLTNMIFGDQKTHSAPYIRKDIDRLLMENIDLREAVERLSEQNGRLDEIEEQLKKALEELEKLVQVKQALPRLGRGALQILKSEWFVSVLLKVSPFGVIIGKLLYDFLVEVLK